MRKQFVLLLLFFVAGKMMPQGMFSVKHYSMNEGLAYTMSKNIVQDSSGYIWLNTWNGIDKFDGYVFRNFKSYPKDKVKLNNNRIEGLSLNAEGNFWVQTYGQQLFLFDPQNEAFENVFAEKQQPLISLVKSLRNGITWAITESQDLYRIDDRNYRNPEGIRFFGHATHPYLGGSVHEIFLDSNGNEWVLTDKGVLTEGKKKIRSNRTFHFITEAGGTICLASRNGYLATYTPNGEFVSLNLPRKFNRINHLKKLDEDQIAIVTPGLIAIYNVKNQTTVLLPSPSGEEFSASGNTFYDSKGRIWAFASGKKIVCYDIKKNKRIVLDYPDFSKLRLIPNSTSFFHEDGYGEIWMLLEEGILCTYNRDENQLETAYYYDSSGKLSYYAVGGRDYLKDTQHNLWVCTRDGFDQISFRSKAYEQVGNSPDEEVRSVFQDKDKRLWMGIKNGKIELYDKEYNYIGNLNSDGKIVQSSDASFGANVYCIHQDDSGNIWLGSRDKGLFVLRPVSKERYNVTLYEPSQDPYSISSKSIYSILQDSKNRIWIGCYGGGLNLAETAAHGKIQFIHAGNKLKNYPVGQCGLVRYVYQSKNGIIMAGTSNGLITFSGQFNSPEEITFFYNSCTSDRSDCLSNSDVRHIFQDRNKNIYVSTFSGGIDITFDSSELLSDKIRFKNINKTSGLTSDLSLSVIEDKKGYIWVVSVNAFSRLNPATGHFDYFNKENLHIPLVMSEATPLVDTGGNLLFGTTNGALRILTDRIQHSTFVPPIVFTGISIQQGKNKTIRKKLLDKEGLVLARDERNVSISFAALDYSNPASILYAYRLKGNTNDWIYIEKNRSASFIDLPAGDHVFQIKSTNSDGVWMDNIVSLPIYVTPTFWETGFAWIIYAGGALLFVLLIILIISYISRLRKQVDFEQELTRLKLKFFTDISHELRTPLTLISNPIEEVLDHEPLSENGKELMHTARQNTERMLRLINQILDFRKIQNNKMKVHLEQVNISVLIEKVFHNFSTIAHQKQITYTLDNKEELCEIYTDTDKVEKIIFNLLSNAFKYTPNGRSVVLTSRFEKNKLLIQVKDEGTGFDIHKAERLFKRFETDNDANPNISSGIGLSLVKELVHLLHGSVDVESAKGAGSTFSVRLPIEYDVFEGDPNVELILSDSSKAEEHAEAEAAGQEHKETSILVIEDNEELRHFIKSILSKEYKVFEAANGKEGLEKTLKEFPSIVVSDVMMPEMDGVEYLNAVKKNHEVSHIPVILLTAKSSIDDQIKGMEYGADDYITKPFSSNYLKTKIASLIKQRELLREYYMSKGGEVRIQIQPSDKWEPSMPKVTNYDDEFITKVVQSIEDNIDDTDFKIETIAESLHMSRPVFYRKIKAIIGLSPIDFVKKIRIKRAVQLLDTRQFTIAEVAYRSGFSTPQYLSKVFKEQMGCSPTEYLQNQQEEK